MLVARLRALFRRGAQERPAVLCAGDLSLLEYLVRRREEVVSKRDILAHVWDDEFEGDPNIVEVYIAHLRNKIDRPFARRTITTVRGLGYRLDGDDG